jgi:hypothetical protein
MPEQITCAQCGADLQNKIYYTNFGFNFCHTYAEKGCMEQFDRALWEAAAQARDSAREKSGQTEGPLSGLEGQTFP